MAVGEDTKRNFPYARFCKSIPPNAELVILAEEIANSDFKSPIPTTKLYEIIDYRSEKFLDNKKEYVGVDLNHHGSNKFIAEYYAKNKEATLFR